MMQFVGTTKDVANQTQDSACRALISLQSNDAYKLAKEGGGVRGNRFFFRGNK